MPEEPKPKRRLTNVAFATEHYEVLRTTAAKARVTMPTLIRSIIVDWLGLGKSNARPVPTPYYESKEEVAIVEEHLRPLPEDMSITRSSGYALGYYVKLGGLVAVYDQQRMKHRLPKPRWLVVYFAPGKEQDAAVNGYENRDDAVRVARLTALASKPELAGGHRLLS